MKHLIKQFMRRDAHPLVQFIKYGMAGGIATVVDTLIFYTLSWKVFPGLGDDDPVVNVLGISVTAVSEAIRSRNYVINRAITFLFSNLVAYILNMLWVFTPGRHNRWVEVGLFYLVSVTSYFIGTFVGWFLIWKFELSTTVAFLANVVAALLINYVCRKYVIFKG